MRAVVRFIIQLAIVILAIGLLVKYTTLDDAVVKFFRSNSNVTTTSGDVAVLDPNTCSTPWGVKIPDGSSVYAYWTDAPGGAGSCKEELRTCNAGMLDGSYPYASCDNSISPSNPDDNGPVAQGASCTTPWGETLNDGAYIIGYESVNSCRFEKRYCENGTLNGSYSANYCNSPSVTSQGSAVAVNVTPTSVVSYGYVQGAQTSSNEYEGPSRTSNNGITTVITSWNNNKTNPTSISANDTPRIQPVPYRNYDLTQHGCTTPWGSYVDSASRVIAYKSSSPVRAGASCEYERRTCFQGVLGGSYAFKTCSIGNNDNVHNNNGQDIFYPQQNTGKSCTTSWGQTVQNGDYVMAYKSSYTSAGNACEGEYRYCRNGVLQGSYQNRSCSMAQNQYRCSLPWGGTLPHGSSVVAYSHTSYSCNSEIRTCNYGRLSGSYKHSYCNSNNNNNGCYGNNCNNNNRSCSLPWGGTISNGSSITAYSSPNGYCQSQTRTCTNGHLNGSYQYSYCHNNDNTCHGNNCNNNNGASCHLPWGGAIAHGSSVVAYGAPSGTCASETRKCQNGVLGGSYGYRTCTPTTTPQSCSLPWGGTIPHGAIVEAYQNSSAPCYKEARTCSNGTLGGSFTNRYCDATPSDKDTYQSRQSAGTLQGNMDNLDTCNNNSSSAYLCGASSSNSCTDYRKLTCTSFSPMVCNYEKRSVSCVK